MYQNKNGQYMKFCTYHYLHVTTASSTKAKLSIWFTPVGPLMPRVLQERKNDYSFVEYKPLDSTRSQFNSMRTIISSLLSIILPSSIVVKALWYKPEGLGFEIRWKEWLLSIYLIILDAVGPGVYSASNTNRYQRQKNNFLGSKAAATCKIDNFSVISEPTV
jgi:hypothetical protein